MNIQIGHSPDPDDAFLFYALTQGKLKFPDLSFTECLEGIEELNQRALKGQLEMTAISLHAYAYCADQYRLLTAGASVGEGVGPIVVAKGALALEELKQFPLAVPGRLTTAALLVQLALGKLELQFMPFDQILPAVQDGKVRAGVLIHEGQLTYASQGLTKLLDLGAWWKAKTGYPVPLGVNVVRRSLGEGTCRKLAQTFKASLDYAFAHRPDALGYAKQFGRGLDAPMTDQFVGMYVNHWAIDCRPDGAEAMQRLLNWAAQEKLIPHTVPIEFVEV